MAEAQLSSIKTQTATLSLSPGIASWRQGDTNPFSFDENIEGGALKILFNGATANGSVVNSWMAVRVQVPNSYVTGSDITLTVRAATSPTANSSSTLDATAFKMDGKGEANGADLIPTAAKDINATSFVNQTFTIGGSLIAGDEIVIQLHATTDDNGGTSNAIARISEIDLSTTCFAKIWA